MDKDDNHGKASVHEEGALPPSFEYDEDDKHEDDKDSIVPALHQSPRKKKVTVVPQTH